MAWKSVCSEKFEEKPVSGDKIEVSYGAVIWYDILEDKVNG